MKKNLYIYLIILVCILSGCVFNTDKNEKEITKVEETSQQKNENEHETTIEQTNENKTPVIQLFLNNTLLPYTSELMREEGQLVAPLRETSELFGWELEWKEQDFITLKSKKETIYFKENSTYYFIDGKKYQTNIPFSRKGELLYFQLRPILESLGYHLSWDETALKVHVNENVQEETVIEPVSIPILVYHHLAPSQYNGIAVDPNRFKEHMLILKENGYTTITDSDLLSYLKKKKNLPEKPILIHFDDGYESVYKYAFPILQELNMKANLYIVGQTVRELTSDSETYTTAHLSWEQIREMEQSNVLEFQSHTYYLHYKGAIEQTSSETGEEYKARLMKDFFDSKALIESKIGTKVIALAYPIGDYNETAELMAREAGYEMTMTMDYGKVHFGDSPYKLKRVYVSGAESAASFIQKVKNIN